MSACLAPIYYLGTYFADEWIDRIANGGNGGGALVGHDHHRNWECSILCVSGAKIGLDEVVRKDGGLWEGGGGEERKRGEIRHVLGPSRSMPSFCAAAASKVIRRPI